MNLVHKISVFNYVDPITGDLATETARENAMGSCGRGIAKKKGSRITARSEPSISMEKKESHWWGNKSRDLHRNS